MEVLRIPENLNEYRCCITCGAVSVSKPYGLLICEANDMEFTWPDFRCPEWPGAEYIAREERRLRLIQAYLDSSDDNPTYFRIDPAAIDHDSLRSDIGCRGNTGDPDDPGIVKTHTRTAPWPNPVNHSVGDVVEKNGLSYVCVGRALGYPIFQINGGDS